MNTLETFLVAQCLVLSSYFIFFSLLGWAGEWCLHMMIKLLLNLPINNTLGEFITILLHARTFLYKIEILQNFLDKVVLHIKEGRYILQKPAWTYSPNNYISPLSIGACISISNYELSYHIYCKSNANISKCIKIITSAVPMSALSTSSPLSSAAKRSLS